MTLIEGLIATAVTVGAALLAFCFVIIFTGFPLIIGSGDHTGYITSVERTGVFWKTGTAYLKTSVQSTQEDAYCVTDPAVYSKLYLDSISGVQVNVHFHSYFSAGVTLCNGEDAIIDDVETL